MASIETVVKVTITRGSQQVPRAAFNIPCVFGSSNRFSEVIRYYQTATDMLTDGFLLSDPEYIHVAEIFSQDNPPSTVGVAKYTAPVTQVDTFRVGTLDTSGYVYKFNMGATVISYTSQGGDTQASILTALLAAINSAFPTNPPVTGVVSGSGSSATLTLTASHPGAGVTYGSVATNLTYASVTANHSIVNDIQTTQLSDDSWYCVLITSKAPLDILQVASYIETQKKIFVTAPNDTTIITASTTDVASQLSALEYMRTTVLYSGTPNTAPDAAWVGRMIGLTPGIGNWKFKTLVGIVADKLSTTQINLAQTKNANVYTNIGGIPVTAEGVAASGEYTDVVIFLDFLATTMEENTYQILVDQQKVPFTDAGIAMIENPVRQTLQIGEANQGLAPGWTVTVPKVSAISQNDKATRTLNGVSFNATLAGAINKVNIQGYVGV